MDLKKVLFVVPFFPYPLRSGGHQAVFNGISAAYGLVDIYLTFPEANSDNIEDDKQQLSHIFEGIHIIPYVYESAPESRVLNWLYKVKYEVKRFLTGSARHKNDSFNYLDWVPQLFPKNDGFCTYINDIITKYDINIVQCELIETAFLSITLPHNIYKIFVEHEIGYVKKATKLMDIGDSSEIGKAHLEMHKDIEIDLINRFNKVVTLSEIDSQKLLHAGVRIPIHTSFSIVDTPMGINNNPICPYHLSFVGPEWHPSNKSGLLWFLENCWEQLLSEDERYRLDVVGVWNRETITSLKHKYPNLCFMGFVPSLKECISGSIMIVPITIGSGIRMKILEAGAIGTPVVSTSVGAEGLPLRSGIHCEIADTPDRFVKSIIKLNDLSLCQRYISSMQSAISSTYTLERLRQNRKALYE